MMKLRLIETTDVAVIQNWASYPPEFKDLDYALRSNGWLKEYQKKPDTQIYIALMDDEIVAFTILSKTAEGEAEFRIVLSADKIGKGLGRTITSMTLAKGFFEIELSLVHLIVRKNNPRAIRLYKRLGFMERSECLKKVNNKQVNFLIMDITREYYKGILQGFF